MRGLEVLILAALLLAAALALILGVRLVWRRYTRHRDVGKRHACNDDVIDARDVGESHARDDDVMWHIRGVLVTSWY